MHHNPTPGPADQPFLYGHVWVTISLALRHPRWGALALPLRALLYFAEQGEFKATHIVRDRDMKFTAPFCAILENDGIEFKPIPPRSPNLNPFAERWVQSVKRECLEHFIDFGKSHLRYLIESYLDWYHRFQPHQGLNNLRIGVDKPLDPVESLGMDDVTCHERLGGLLKHYERKVA